MNRIYRTVWNAVRGKLVAVEESKSGAKQASGAGRKGALVRAAAAAAMAGAAAAALLPGAALAADDADKVYNLTSNDTVGEGNWEMLSTGTINLSDSLTVDAAGYFRTVNLKKPEHQTTFYTGPGGRITVNRLNRERFDEVMQAQGFDTSMMYSNFEIDRWENSGTSGQVGSGIIREYAQSAGDLEFNGILELGAFDLTGGTVRFTGDEYSATKAAAVGGTGALTLASGKLALESLALNDAGRVTVEGGKLSAANGIDIAGAESVFRIEAVAAMDGNTAVKVTGGTLEAASRGLSFGGDFTKGVIRTDGSGTLTLTKAYDVKAGMTFENPSSMTFSEGLTVSGGQVSNGGNLYADKPVTMSAGEIASTGFIYARDGFTMTGGKLGMSVDQGLTQFSTEEKDFAATGGEISGEGEIKAKNITLSGALAMNAAGIDLSAEEKISTAGDFTAGDAAAKTLAVEAGALQAQNVSARTGSVSADAELRASQLSLEAGDVFTNEGTLDVAALDAKAAGRILNKKNLIFSGAGETDGATIAMQGSAAALTIRENPAKAAFFTNTNFEVLDGAVMNLADYGQTTLGAGNKYVLRYEGWDGAIAPDGNSHVGAAAFDGMSTLEVANLTSEGEVTIEKGGLLKTDAVNLTAEDTVHLAGGALMTKLGGMFEGVSSESILINAESTDDTVVIDSALLGVSELGDLKSGVETGIDWQSGTVAFTDSYVGLSAVAASQAAIGTAAGDAAASVQVVFTGDVSEAVSGDGLTIDTIKALQKEQAAISGGSPVINPGVVLAGSVLKNTENGTAAPKLVFGLATDDESYGIDLSIGFSKIANADEIQVLADREAVLTGVARADGTTWSSDDAKLLPDAAAGGKATIEEGGRLTFGTYGLSCMTAGWLQDVANLGTLTVKSGEYGIKGTYSTAGTTDVQKGSTLHVNDFDAKAGSKTNVADGGLKVGTLDIDAGAAVTLTGKSTLEAAGDAAVAGKLSASAETAGQFKNLAVKTGGDAALLGGATGEELALETNAAATLSGSQNWQHVKLAGFYSDDKAELAVDASGVLTLEAAQESDITGGRLTNAGKLDFTKVDELALSGELVNNAGSASETTKGAHYDDLLIGTLGEDRNAGYEAGDLLTIRGVWQNAGTAVWNGFEANDSVGGSIDADNLAGASLKVGANGMLLGKGSVTNAGHIDATAGLVTVSGAQSENTGDAEWAYDDLTITAGSSTNRAWEHGDVLTVAGNEASWLNTGRAEWQGVRVEAGEAAVGADGILTVGTAEAEGSFEIKGGQFWNMGETDTTHVPVVMLTGGASQNGENGKTDAYWHYDDLTITGGASTNYATEEGHVLTIADAGSWTNKHIAIWNTVDVKNQNAVNDGTILQADVKVKAGGKLSGEGSIAADAGRTLEVAGALEQKSVQTGNVAVAAAGSADIDETLDATGLVKNEGAITAGKISTGTFEGTAGSRTEVTGEFAAGTGATNAGVLEADSITITAGRYENAAGGATTVAGAVNADVVSNAGGMTLGTVSNFGKDNTYVRDGADSVLTIADGSHFSGTNVTFTGGGDVYVSGFNGHDANFAGLDGSLGENSITISGDAPYELTGDHAAAYPAGTTTVYVDRLGSETDVSIEAGGRLVAGSIDFDGTVGTAHLEGGVFSTTLGEIFGMLSEKYVLIDADSPDDTADVDSMILGVDAVDGIRDEVLAGLDLVEGALGFTDEAVSTGTVAAVADAVADAAGSNADKIDVVFDGGIYGDAGKVGDLTVEDVKDLFAEQAGKPGSAVTNPGVILAGTSLDASGDADQVLTVGPEGEIAGSIGFETVKGVDEIKVDGSRGTLVGGVLDPEKTGEHFNWTDGSRLIESETAGEGGRVDIGEEGRYDFGSKGTAEKHTGWVDEVENNGRFHVANGEYGIKGDLSTGSAGESTVGDDAVLHTGGIAADGRVTNEGEIVLDGALGSQQIAVNEGGELDQKGALDANGKDAVVAGEVHTSGDSAWHDMTVTESGANHVAAGGREDGGVLDLTHGGRDAWTVDEGGESHWNEVIAASGSNDGTVSVGDDAGREDGVRADDSRFDVAAGGAYVNTGILDLTGAGNAEISGAITTGDAGETRYDDLTLSGEGTDRVAAGGSETGDILDLTQTAEGGEPWIIEAGGSADWNEVRDAAGTNDGTITVGTGDHPDDDGDGKADDGDFNVAAGDEFTNTGDLDLTGAGNTEIDGTITTVEGGETKYDDLTIGPDGTDIVEAGGREEGDILDLTGADSTDKNPWQVAEGGESHWNEVWDADGTNDGTITVGTGEHPDDDGDGKADDGDFNVAAGDDFTNTGDLDLTDAGNTEVDGTVTTGEGGTTKYDDLTVNPDGNVTVEAGGSDSGDILDLTPGGDYGIEEGGKADWNEIWVGRVEGDPDAPDPSEGGGSFTNDGDATVDKVVVGEGGEFGNTGRLDGGELEIGDGGLVNITGGSTDFEKTTIDHGGWLVVGNGEAPQADDKAVYDFDASNPVEGDIFVVNNGELVFSGEGVDESFDDLIKAPQLPGAPVKVVVGGTVHVGAHGSLNFGNGTYEKPAAGGEGEEAGGRGTANVETGTGNLFFGKDSTTVISVPGIGTGPAFASEAAGATVTVEDGATLILGNVDAAGQYLITDGFLTEDGSLVGGWLDEDHLYALNEDGTGLDWVLDLGFDNDSIWVDVAYADIRTEYPDMVQPGNVNDALQHGSDPRGPQDVFLNEVLKDKTIGAAEKTRIINSVAQIGAAGGVFGSAFDGMSSAVDSLESRVSFAGETFTHSGRMVSGETGTDLWATVLGGTHETDSLSSSGKMSGGYETDVYGIMAGLDHRLEGQNARLGIALSYQDGDLESTGDWLKAQNDYQTFGIQAYANYSPSEHFNLIGSFGYFRNSAEVSMGLPAASKTFRKASADVDANMIAAAVRAEGRFDLGPVSVIPHAGVRMLVQDAGAYDTKLDGRKAFRSDAQSTTTGQIPIGVAFRGDFSTASGWTFRPTADVTVMPQFGDKDVKTTVTGADTGIAEAVSGEMTGSLVATGALGIQAEKGGWTVGAGCSYTGGSAGKSDTVFNVNVRWRF